ncbi:glycosyltransferase family 39 protein [Helicobacter canis]|uniref:Glycosyltransferase RgtA/B/C/D-like domain-containing protein n=1 Tax=Helicobacter canis TaxID=29419 RepID=A0A377J6B5_9HELI|nr:glycosyltransferase family 39 protein [Helicobacter canis]STO97366.1 Uncharacterised protein [Helicobacter canis]
MRNFRDNLALYALMAVCFAVFCYMGWRYVDVEFLALTNGDAMPQFLQLQKMSQGLITLNIKQFFAFEFYNYGFFYYVLNLLAALPFIITENYPLQIYAPRVLNALFSIANLWLLYRIARIYLSACNALLLVGVFVAMAGFWHLGYVFKPDVFQGFFVLACAYYLLRDNFSFGKHYMLAWVALGLGIGLAKFQAILFIPMMYAYICLPALSMQAGQILLALKRCALGTLGVVALWIASNPYLLHKSGFNAWLSMFEGNMRSNATNHGAYTQVSLGDKLAMIDFYYFEIIVFIALLGVCGYLVWLGLVRVFRDSAFGEIHKQTIGQNKDSSKDYSASAGTMDCHASAVSRNDDKKVDSRENAQNLESTFEKTLSSRADEVGAAIHKEKADSSPKPQSLISFTPIAAGFLVSLIYLLFFVNKAWEAYYFSTMALGCVLYIPLALACAKAFMKTSKGGGAAQCKAIYTLSNRCAITLACIADSRRVYV